MDLGVPENNAGLPAERGHVYEFDNGKSLDTRYILVVSADTRKCDRIISSIMCGQSSVGRDVVCLNMPVLGEHQYVHCGLITTTSREYLVRDIGVVSADVMSCVDKFMAKELGIFEDLRMEVAFYRQAYNNIVGQLVGQLSAKSGSAKNIKIGDMNLEEFSRKVSSEDI